MTYKSLYNQEKAAQLLTYNPIFFLKIPILVNFDLMLHATTIFTENWMNKVRWDFQKLSFSYTEAKERKIFTRIRYEYLPVRIQLICLMNHNFIEQIINFRRQDSNQEPCDRQACI